MGAEVEGKVNIIIKAVNKAEDGISGAVSSFDKLGRATGAAVLGGAAVAGAAVAGVVAKGVMEFTKFEDSMNEVFTLLPGISEQAMGQMNRQVLEASENMGRLPNEIIPALYQSLSAGVPSENVFEFLDTAHAAALGGVTELETAVDGISSVVNAYGSDVIGATEASDLMFTAVRLGKTTFGELSSSLSNVTPLASGMGVSFGDVTAALAAMTAQGTPTAQATTQMRSLLQELGTAGTEVADTFTELAGQTFIEFVNEGGNTAQALQMLEEYAADAGIPLQDMFGNVRAGLGALQLTGKGMETFVANLDEMEGSAGATDAAYERMNQGFARTIEVLKAKVATTFIKVGDAVAPVVKMLGEKLVGAFDALMPYIETFIGVFGQLLEDFFNGGDMIEGVAMAIETLGERFGLPQEKISELMDVWYQLSEETIPMLMAKFEEIKQKVLEFITPIAEGIAQFVSWKDILIVLAGVLGVAVLSAIVSIVTAIGPLLLAIGAAVAIVAILRNAWENNWGGIQEKVAAVLAFLREIIGTVVAWIKDFWAANGDEILAKAQQIWETIKAVITTIINIIWNVIKTVVSNLQAFWEAHGESIKATAGAVWNWIKSEIERLINMIKTIVTTVATALQEFWTQHGEQIKQTAQTAWDAIKATVETITGIISSIFAAFKSAFEGDWSAFGANLRDAWDKAWQAIKTALTTVIPQLVTAIAGLVTDIIAKFTEIDWGQIGSDIIHGVADGITSATQFIVDAAKKAAKAAYDAALAFLHIGSPSKLFFEVGVNTMKGFGLGLLNEQQNLYENMKDTFGPAVQFAATGRRDPQLVGQPFGPTTNSTYNLTVVTSNSDADIMASFRVLEAFANEV